MRNSALTLLCLALAAGCSSTGEGGAASASVSTSQESYPAAEGDALTRLSESPRHGEWVTVRTGAQDSVRAWVVYPERSDRAPVVLVVHEIFGLSHWIRAVADQLAADGFIAIAPDLLTMRNIPAGEDGAPNADMVRQQIGSLNRDDIHRQLLAVAEYGMSLPAAERRYGIVGFCWGGTVSFEHAMRSPDLAASVVYYGSTSDTLAMANVRAPVLGLYGGDDARVNATIPASQRWMQRNGKTYEPTTFEGAGHGFLRAQTGQNGANMPAAQAAWRSTIQWFRSNLEG